MLFYVVPAWLITTVIGCAIVNTSNKDKVKVYNCRKLVRRYKKLDEAYNKSMF